MKFKEKRGNTYVFDGGYAGQELEMSKGLYGGMMCWTYEGVILFGDNHVKTAMGEIVPFQDIQTAVNLMQILIKEGLA